MTYFLYILYNDLKNTLVENNSKGIDIGHLKTFLLMYADDIVIFADNPKDLQENLDILSQYYGTLDRN